ncbi:MAG: hypothetical protein SVZ03_11815 [Spirochaetota bacterium]|nr:hypothetical protein [Spirochaetota bacterium]
MGSISEMYDDNITASSDDQEYDFITYLMLGLGINHEGRFQSLTLAGRTYQQFHINNQEDNYNSQDLTLDYIYNSSRRSRFQLADTFNHYPEPRSFEVLFGRTDVRVGYYSNIFELTYLKTLSRYFSFNIRYTNQLYNYSGGEVCDSYSNGAGVGVEYSWNNSNIIYPFYDFTYTKYDTGEANSEQMAGIEYRHSFTRQFYTNCCIGGVYIITIDGTQNTYPYLLTSITYEIDENNTINVLFIKQTNVVGYSEDPFENIRISGEASRQMLRDLSLSLSAFYGYGEYTLSDTTTELIGVTTSLAYDIKENIEGSLVYTYTNNKAEGIETTEYSRNQVILMVTAEF